MARVTINDCLSKVNNHFQLVLIATVRAREILSGKSINIPREGSTVAVIALREIAEGAIDINRIKNNLPFIFNTNEDISNNLDANNSENEQSNTVSNNENNTLVIEETDGNTLLSSEE